MNNWSIAAQEHYSFLEHLENNDLEKYHYDIWDYHYGRLSINLICIWGDDIVDNIGFVDDEEFLTVELPKKLGRREFHPLSHFRRKLTFRLQTRSCMVKQWHLILASVLSTTVSSRPTFSHDIKHTQTRMCVKYEGESLKRHRPVIDKDAPPPADILERVSRPNLHDLAPDCLKSTTSRGSQKISLKNSDHTGSTPFRTIKGLEGRWVILLFESEDRQRAGHVDDQKDVLGSARHNVVRARAGVEMPRSCDREWDGISFERYFSARFLNYLVDTSWLY